MTSPYRKRLVGLPLQRSMFCEIDRAPEILGLPGVLPGDRLAVSVDPAGDLYLDRDDIARLGSALASRMTPELLAAMDRRLRSSCEAVIASTDRAGRSAASADMAGVRTLLGELAGSVAALLPYGILTKFVPDALLAALRALGDTDDAPFPTRSPGAELTAAAATLAIQCQARGFSPPRLTAEWPAVPAEVAALVRTFCALHTGFGPLAWEAPGYEDPRYVFSTLTMMFADDHPEALLRRLGRMPLAPPDRASADQTPMQASLRTALAAWLDFLERETWYVRRAFYLGLLPLLRRLLPAFRAADPDLPPDALLFLELGELLALPANARAAGPRRARYLAESAYLAERGIDGGRLHDVMVAA